MHSRRFHDTTFHFNGGLDCGKVIIVDNKTQNEVVVDVEDLLTLVAEEYILPKRISELEQADYKELLK